MDWTQLSQIMDESFPNDLLLDTQSEIEQTVANKFEFSNQNLNRGRRRTSLPVPVVNVEKRKLYNTLSVIPCSSCNETNDTSGFESKGTSEQNSPKSESVENLCKPITVPESDDKQQTQSKDSAESVYSSYRYSRSRPVNTFRQRSRSEVDFKAINRKKYAHVQSKVKRYIDQISRENHKPRVQKQKSLPNLHESQKQSTPYNDPNSNSMYKTSSTNTVPISPYSPDEFEEQKKIIQELREYVNQLESNFQDKQEENYALKKKIEQMRGKLYQLTERRSSAPTAPPVTFYESQQIDIPPFSSIITPVKKRPFKLVASKAIQTSFRDSDSQQSLKLASHNRPLFDTFNDENGSLKRSTSEVVIRQVATDIPRIQDEEGNLQRSLLDKSRSSFQQLHVSFKPNDSVHIIDERSDKPFNGGTNSPGGSETNDKSDKVKKSKIFRKILNCFRSKK